MKVNSKKFLEHFEQVVPTHLAEDWDKKNIGFVIGNINRTINKILLCLEVTEKIVDEAIDTGIDLIITHHPVTFVPLKKLTDSDDHQRMIRKMIKNDINLYVAHTNFDIVKGGLNDFVAEKLELKRVKYLQETNRDLYYKMVVYIPIEKLDDVSEAMFENGAGHIGNYSDCGFSQKGLGTFRPDEGTKPYIGEHGVLEEVEEVRFETIVPKDKLSKVLVAMHKTHPYEEVAYDLYKLENKITTDGLGKCGFLDQRQTMTEFIDRVKSKLDVERLRFIGNIEHKVSKVALLTGAGDDFIDLIKSTGVDVFVTGDFKHQHAFEAKKHGVNVIDIGHFESEKFFAENAKVFIDKIIEEQEYDLKVMVSENEENPIQYY